MRPQRTHAVRGRIRIAFHVFAHTRELVARAGCASARSRHHGRESHRPDRATGMLAAPSSCNSVAWSVRTGTAATTRCVTLRLSPAPPAARAVSVHCSFSTPTGTWVCQVMSRASPAATTRVLRFQRNRSTTTCGKRRIDVQIELVIGRVAHRERRPETVLLAHERRQAGEQHHVLGRANRRLPGAEQAGAAARHRNDAKRGQRIVERYLHVRRARLRPVSPGPSTQQRVEQFARGLAPPAAARLAAPCARNGGLPDHLHRGRGRGHFDADAAASSSRAVPAIRSAATPAALRRPPRRPLRPPCRGLAVEARVHLDHDLGACRAPWYVSRVRSHLHRSSWARQPTLISATPILNAGLPRSTSAVGCTSATRPGPPARTRIRWAHSCP